MFIKKPTTAKFILRLLDSIQTNQNSIALVDQNGQRETTYWELYIMACRVAGYIRAKGIPSQSRIVISLPTCMEYVAAELGIWLKSSSFNMSLSISFWIM